MDSIPPPVFNWPKSTGLLGVPGIKVVNLESNNFGKSIFKKSYKISHTTYSPIISVPGLSFAALLWSAKIVHSSRSFCFFIEEYGFGVTFVLKWFFGNFNFKTTLLPKQGPIFDQAAKLGKASQDA